jgi:hypothetical protein
MSVYILCSDKILKKFRRRLQGLKLKNFAASFTTNTFQDRDTRENLCVMCSKENASETKLGIITWQEDIYMQMSVNNKRFGI